MKAPHQAAAAAASSSSSAAAAASAAVHSAAAPKPRTVLSQATAALDSFEQRILQRKQQQQEQSLLFSSSILAPSAGASSSSSSSSSSSGGAARSRLSTTCDPAAAASGCGGMVDAPGGLRIFKRRRSELGGALDVHAEDAAAPLEEREQAHDHDDALNASNVSLASARDSDYRSDSDACSDVAGDENACVEGGNGAGGMASLWNRVTSYFVQKITPSKAPNLGGRAAVENAPGGPAMSPVKFGAASAAPLQPRQPLAPHRMN